MQSFIYKSREKNKGRDRSRLNAFRKLEDAIERYETRKKIIREIHKLVNEALGNGTTIVYYHECAVYRLCKIVETYPEDKKIFKKVVDGLRKILVGDNVPFLYMNRVCIRQKIPHFVVRKAVISVLGEIAQIYKGDKKSLLKIIDLLKIGIKDECYDVVLSSVLRLRGISSDNNKIKKIVNAVIRLLVEALGDESEIVRASAASGLIGIGVSAIPMLKKAAKSNSVHVRSEAVYVLGEIGAENIIDEKVSDVIVHILVKTALGDKDITIQKKAIWNLEKMMKASPDCRISHKVLNEFERCKPNWRVTVGQKKIEILCL